MEKERNNSKINFQFLSEREIFTEEGIREVQVEAGAKVTFRSNSIMAISIMEGEIMCNLDGLFDYVGERNLLYVNIGSDCTIEALVDTKLIFLWAGYAPLREDSSAQEYTHGATINHVDPESSLEIYSVLPVLPFNSCMDSYFEAIPSCFTYPTQYYYSLKVREFFFLMGKSYSLNDRLHFFDSLNSIEQSFTAFVQRNYRNVSSIKEFADLANCSVSSFEKRFRRIFGQTASIWMARKKAQLIHSDICGTSKPFKQLSYEHGFSYPAHFTRFCKTHLGESPSILREKYQSKEINLPRIV